MARRGPGEGSIYQRKSDGRWVGALRLGYARGRRIRRYVYGQSRREVHGKLQAALAKQEAGLRLDQERLTVAQYLDIWLAQQVVPNLRSTTVRGYQTAVRVHLTPALGCIRLADLRAHHVQEMVRAMTASGLRPRTVAQAREVLRNALNTARRWDLLERNAAELTDVPRQMPVERRALSPSEARRFTEAIQGSRFEVLLLMAISTGLRQGELLGLRWVDVDLEARELRVSGALARGGGHMELAPPKSRAGRRTLPISVGLSAALRAHRSRQLEQRLWAGPRWRDGDFVFTTSVGTPVDPNRVRSALYEVLEAAGLPRITFHDLRHSCASLLAADGVPPRTIMAILGHTDFRLTMNVYTHIDREAKQDALGRMDALLGKGS